MYADDFYAGVVSALSFVAQADQETLYREIVRAVGESDLIKHAKKHGQMKWSGLSTYGYGGGIAEVANG